MNSKPYVNSGDAYACIDVDKWRDGDIQIKHQLNSGPKDRDKRFLVVLSMITMKTDRVTPGCLAEVTMITMITILQ